MGALHAREQGAQAFPCRAELRRDRQEFEATALLYPFAAAFLATNGLIEQRYTIVPAVLLLLLRRRRSGPLEAAILAGLGLESALITYGMERFGF